MKVTNRSKKLNKLKTQVHRENCIKTCQNRCFKTSDKEKIIKVARGKETVFHKKDQR